ncbi:SDR family NAD(P)-dependent oxidoreductase [Myxococcus sp. MISCRS1]|jgi:short-subunit dehydrogenase|uniref:SDR family NAD(P)-dependent oxidoreductase n=1 Tax=Myxococcus TaxID=32 RepID=UPI001CBF0FF6|nr:MULTISPECIES: SDR family NAD(P)-dependent oxidoreductase [unclassified Myxococcus]MBZ4394451.1 SDR family NAD(P)-dependent oxidoreductase [Myxococcus sp. AS-1-15]MBZ4410545.1 SDR family NAD(P)-dependent oxidoreductase [Myxococcus sp. XM-1-1-1]MCY1001419.1 SDR family NAD(P)-dependent oxidoreductase [Myxococcus sp. MISCRS1]
MAEMSYRTALVTGASSGLGRGLALWLARRGLRVFAAGRRVPQLQALAAEAQAAGATVEPVELDVSRAEPLMEKLRELDSECGGLDLVIANAGVGGVTHGKRLEWDKVRSIIDTNVTGAVATLTAVLPSMVERRRGHVVGISSLAAHRGLAGHAAYSASKAFLATFMESLRVDLAGTGVCVTCIFPGFVKSEMTAANHFPMPFLMETDAAVELMGSAILRGETEVSFPWQLAIPSRLAKVLPNPLFDAAARRLR